jgi:ClpP class serine protease
MRKKRYCLYLSRPLAHQLERVASLRHGSKSALLEEALRKSFEPEQVPGVEEGLVRRLNELHRAVAAMARDVTVASETLALFVRYMLTVTPPIPDGDQESARLTGRKRYDVFLAEVGKRVAENALHAAEVLRTVPVDQPDLFSTAHGGSSLKSHPSLRPQHAAANGRAAEPKEGSGHA